MLNEKQLKYQNKVKLISFIILVVGLLLVLFWSIKNKEVPENTEPQSRTLAINYKNAKGEDAKYDYTCASDTCVLASQAGEFALVKDESYKLVNLASGASTILNLPTMTKNFMVANGDFYGLVYTKDETNGGSFYEHSKTRTIYDGELNYDEMNADAVRESLTKLYPRGYFYIIKDSVGKLYKLDDNTLVIDNISGMVSHNTELYIASEKGISYFDAEGQLIDKLTDAKQVFAEMHEEKFVILDKDNFLKLSTLDGERSDKMVEVKEGRIQSIKVENGIVRIIIEDKDYETTQKLIKYEYDIDNTKLSPIE